AARRAELQRQRRKRERQCRPRRQRDTIAGSRGYLRPSSKRRLKRSCRRGRKFRRTRRGLRSRRTTRRLSAPGTAQLHRCSSSRLPVNVYYTNNTQGASWRRLDAVGAPGLTRTDTPVKELDFESSASTIPPQGHAAELS